MRPLRAHAVLSALFVVSRLLLDRIGLRFSFSVDWMWLADPADLRDRLIETLVYFHAFPPGINALTGVLLKFGESNAPVVAHALFWGFGLILVNLLFYLGRAAGLSSRAAFGFGLAFSLAPASIYFEHLYHYEWPVITLLCMAAALFHRGVYRPSVAVWLGFFAVSAAVGLTRSTFHLAWFAAVAGLGAWLTARGARRVVVASALIPGVLLATVYAKNLMLFGEFAVSTFGPASYTLVTVDHLPDEVRDAWISQGRLSAFAAMSVYSPPRDYSRFFATPNHEAWPSQLTRLDHRGVAAANFNHWWLLEVHRARRHDAMYYLRERPLGYVANVLEGLRDMFGASTTWHPRDRTPASPHYQHRQVLGGYERWFNRVVHAGPVAPFGLYIFLPAVLLWTCAHLRPLVRSGDPATRARGALLAYCVFQTLYVVAASSMLTFLESSRYRFQVEWAIWLMTAVCFAAITSKVVAASRTRMAAIRLS